MIPKRIVRFLLPFLLFLFLSTGCSWRLGDAGPERRIDPPTIGEQLIDLHRALENGVISEEEYEEIRERILHGDPAAP